MLYLFSENSLAELGIESNHVIEAAKINQPREVDLLSPKQKCCDPRILHT